MIQYIQSIEIPEMKLQRRSMYVSMNSIVADQQDFKAEGTHPKLCIQLLSFHHDHYFCTDGYEYRLQLVSCCVPQRMAVHYVNNVHVNELI